MKRPAAVPRGPAAADAARRPVVLLVCQANVCRSRAAEELLRRRLTSAGLALDVRSAGTAAPAHARRCPSMDALLRARGLELPTDDGTRQLDAAVLERASLVLVAERRHRAHAARVDPGARSRTFTLVEAAALATGVRAVDPLVADPSRATAVATVEEALREVAADLHAARGSVELPGSAAAGRRLPWRSSGVASGIDLLDVHERSARVHRRSLQQLDGALEAVVALLAERLPR